MAAKIFRINYKSDFILTLNSDAGWMTPFCIKFWTGAPSQAFFVGWDGETYTHCAPVAGEPTKLLVQFDDHHLPIGDLKFQIAYHFTVADFPNDTEDEVINPANITTEIDGETYQVMLDFTGETAPEIEFSLPAYANEAQRIANEQQRIANEEQRIADEQTRISNEQTRVAQEQTRQQNEAQRIAQESARVSEFASLKSASEAATRDANNAATLANEKAQLADDKAALADSAATQASLNAVYAHDEGQLAGQKATEAAQATQLATNEASFAHDQGTYAKNQGDYAKEQGDTALADHQRAEADHGIAVDDHTQAGNDHTRAESDHSTSAADHTTAGNDHTRAESDHGIAVDDQTQAGNDHTRAESDHGIAVDDHTTAGNDHTRAESDHTRAESDHAAVEVYVDSLGAFDISAYHATGGVLAEYADLTAALGTNGANIPDALRKGGMSVKFVTSSDHKYVQYRLMSQTWSTNTDDWSFCGNDVYVENPEFVYVQTDAEDKILFAIRTDGCIFFGAGVPPQVIDYINEKLGTFTAETYKDVVDFLGSLIEGDQTIAQLLADKVDKVEGKGLSTNDFTNDEKEVVDCNTLVENPEYMQVETDSEDKILGGRKIDGTKFENLPFEFQGAKVYHVESPEWINVLVDAQDRIIAGVRTDGSVYINKIEGVTDAIEEIREYINNLGNYYSLKVCKYKKYSAIGDSLTNASPWINIVKKILGIEEVTRAGASGLTMADVQGQNSIHSSIMAMTEDNNVDLISIWAGTNDYSYNVPLGDFDEQYSAAFRDTTTFYGAYMDSIEHLFSVCPKARIFLVGTTDRISRAYNSSDPWTDAKDGNLTKYVDAVNKLAEKYGLPFLDLLRTSGINKFNIDQYMFLQTYPSENPVQEYYLHFNYGFGTQQIAQRIAAFINTIG